MTTQPAGHPSTLSQRVSENLTTLMFRLRWSQRTLSQHVKIPQSSMSRKRAGGTDWTVSEVETLATATFVTPAELMGDLPAHEVWLPRLDSNQQPFGYARDYRSGFGPFICPECGREFARMGDLHNHRQRQHVAVVVDLAAYRAERRAS